jgi:putative transposase
MRIRREHPTWGAPKIREKLRQVQHDSQLPAVSTVHAVLHRHGLLNVSRKRRQRRRRVAIEAAVPERPVVRMPKIGPGYRPARLSLP